MTYVRLPIDPGRPYDGVEPAAVIKPHVALQIVELAEAKRRAAAKMTQAQPAPDAQDEAAVDALDKIIRHEGNWNASDCADSILAAIRAGKVPGVIAEDQRSYGTILAEIDKAYRAIGAPDSTDPDARDPHYVGDHVAEYVAHLKAELAAMRERVEKAEKVLGYCRRHKDTMGWLPDPDVYRAGLGDAEKIKAERDDARATADRRLGLLRVLFHSNSAANPIHPLTLRQIAAECGEGKL